MKKILVSIVVLLFAVPVFAADGDLNVNGQLSAGTAGIKFSDGSVQTKASGPTTQNNLTSSRALGTVYQNTTGKPMYVNATIRVTSGPANIYANSDSNTSPGTLVAMQSGFSNTEIRTLSFFVLPGNYYMVNFSPGSGTVYNWIECN